MTEADWRFDESRIPDSELIPCLIWEYLRESQTVADLARDWREHFARGGEGSDRLLLERTARIQPSLNFPSASHDFAASIVRIVFGLDGNFGIPWQRLGNKVRVEFTRWASVAPPVFVAAPPYLSILRSASSEFDSVEPYRHYRTVLSGRAPRWMVGQELMLLVVNWPAYDAGQIRKALQKFTISLRRPKGVPSSVRSGPGLGRAAELRGKLRSLGLARLNARYGAAQLKRELPAAYNHIACRLGDRGPTAVDKALRAARKSFERAFHRILPFEKRAPLCLAQSRFAR